MKNLDTKIDSMAVRQTFFDALRDGSEEDQIKALEGVINMIQEDIMSKANEQMELIGAEYTDDRILAERGIMKPLTTAEKKYFNAVIERGGFDGVEELFPTTIVQDVFRDLRQSHPILSRVDAKNTTALAKFIFADPTQATAFWGPICEDIRQMIIEGFKVVKLESSRLSGFVVICKGMLELGPAWLAQYVTEVIREIMATSLELAIVDGTGENQPIGITKQLSGAVDSVYPDKPKVELDDFEPASLAGIRAALAQAKTDNGEVVILVNPLTYWAKVFPNLAFQANDGRWVLDVLPTGETIIQSHAVPEDTLIWGVLKNYFLGISGEVRIDRYDQTLAIEDLELFIAKFYGYGIAKNRNAFFVADVTSVAGATIPSLEEEAVVVP